MEAYWGSRSVKGGSSDTGENGSKLNRFSLFFELDSVKPKHLVYSYLSGDGLSSETCQCNT